MRIFLTIAALTFILSSCGNEDVKVKSLKAGTDTTNYTSITWLDSIKDIGTVPIGKTSGITFKFKNTGAKPLFIISAQPGCGCTIADYPKGAIAPNAEGVITADYNIHKGSTGGFRKNIVVTTNTKGSTSHILYFFGKVKNEDDSTSLK